MRPRRLTAGERVTVSGRVVPAAAGVEVRLQQRRGRRLAGARRRDDAGRRVVRASPGRSSAGGPLRVVALAPDAVERGAPRSRCAAGHAARRPGHGLRRRHRHGSRAPGARRRPRPADDPARRPCRWPACGPASAAASCGPTCRRPASAPSRCALDLAAARRLRGGQRRGRRCARPRGRSATARSGRDVAGLVRRLAELGVPRPGRHHGLLGARSATRCWRSRRPSACRARRRSGRRRGRA